MAKQTKSPASKPRLGRGLSSLLANTSPLANPDETSATLTHADASPETPSQQTQSPAPGSHELPVDQIAPNPYQPRKDFPPQELAELADSITRQGILQPLIVSPATDPSSEQPYVLVAGERRLRAARQAGLTMVPCVIRPASPQQMLEWALVENIQRTDLNPVERAQAYRDYMDRFQLTQAEAAEHLGQARPTVANYLRILELCDNVQGLLVDGRLTLGHAKVLASLIGDPKRQVTFARRIVARGLTVRQTEKLLAASRGEPTQQAAPTVKTKHKSPYLQDLEERLTRCVGTRVQILPGRTKHSGRIVLEYYSLDDFDRIAAGLGLQREQ